MYLTVTASFCSKLWASEYRPLLGLHPSTSHGWMGGWSGGGDCHCPYSDSSGHSSCHYSLQAANKASNELRPSEGVHVERTAHEELSTVPHLQARYTSRSRAQPLDIIKGQI